MTEPKTDPKVARAAERVVDAAADAITTAAKATTTEAPAPAKPTGKAKAYTADRDVYQDNVYTKAGEVFVTNAPKGEGWTERKPAEVAAIEASTNLVPDQPSLEAASKSALQAVAIIKNVSIVGLDKPELIDAIKAANEPRL